ncbi:ABC transporter ATP-binding protein [Nodosilinea nodulosa]|uniref:ABC transporter ATP-binding protein n=1 Tax=Nodosilinea nodulosa TaxID=416001 RepID=UPI00030E1EBF|nr:ABC transporter ATP-binding protein [Nodosilinea nodulosa]
MTKLSPNLLIEAQNLRRTYHQGGSLFTALDSASFQVWAGDRIALIGRSGSGKSTLLNLMGGLDTPTDGTIAWVGLGPRETLRPAKVAFVFQMPSLLAPLTVIENVEMPLLLGDTPIEIARTAAMEALERLQLTALAQKLPEELSGGQIQRIAVARTLAYHPKLILADEPTGQLDHPTATLLLDTLFNTLKDTDTALVIATHDPLVADRMHKRWTIQHGILQTDSSHNGLQTVNATPQPKLSITRPMPKNSAPF